MFVMSSDSNYCTDRLCSVMYTKLIQAVHVPFMCSKENTAYLKGGSVLSAGGCSICMAYQIVNKLFTEIFSTGKIRDG